MSDYWKFGNFWCLSYAATHGSPRLATTRRKKHSFFISATEEEKEGGREEGGREGEGREGGGREGGGREGGGVRREVGVREERERVDDSEGGRQGERDSKIKERRE